jgi:porin
MMRRLRHACLAFGLATCAAAAPARAQDGEGFWARDTLLGDPAGTRAALQRHGVTVSLQQTGEGWANMSGGQRTGQTYGGQTLGGITLDTAGAGLWQGGTVYVSGLMIFGQWPGQMLVGGQQNPSGNAAPDGPLLYEAWYQQQFDPHGSSLRVGQIRADAEFLTSLYGPDPTLGGAGALFLNAAFGFPTVYSYAMPAGGPAYPLATPGIRLKLAPHEDVRLLAAVFNGTPSSAAFAFRGGYTVMSELQVLAHQRDGATALPGAYRIGVWASNQGFGDQRRDQHNLSLANPLSDGVPMRQSGNWGAYAMADQLLLQTGPTRDQAIGASLRVALTLGDRSPLDAQINAALTWKGAIPGRSADMAGLGVSLVHHGLGARGYDQDVRRYTNPLAPIQGLETVFEATYAIQVAGWWQVQPDLQYIIRPGGGVASPANPGILLHNAFLAGIRSVVTF